ncbi:MAG: type II toxin-antitoxin system VapB family antitoxin [Deltaproteobacteria bacterium]|nr:type II toxin-antitoxin system VapB family antitoxin [Deltaproteobacteria bacterium]
MRTTLHINDELLEEARALTGLQTKTEIVEAGLKALVQAASAQRLSMLAGSVKDASAPYRRRAHQLDCSI